jgi:competence protein ComEC
MLTHGDNDHVGGADSVFARMPVRRLLAGPSVNMPQQVELCTQGQRWQWDDVDFQVLHPTAVDSGRENDSSCVLRIASSSGAGMAALLLGDVEHEVEARLVASGAIHHAEIVVVPHHGSLTSSTEMLTRAVAPNVAVISAGYGNRWGFPKPEVLARWHAVGARVLKTADSGAIEIAVSAPVAGATTVDLSEYRKQDRAYWRR